MNDLWAKISDFLTEDRLTQLVAAGALLLLGLILARLLGASVRRATRDRLSPQHSQLAGRIVYYLVTGLALASVLRELGVDLSLLVGAAGILTVALGFASQTSVSNLISGLFLMAEEAFGQGDVIRVGGTTGEVLSVDLLSVKLRTFDNLFVRIPNETLLKSEITNLTRFPIRRLDLPVSVDYRTDLKQAEELLIQLAERNPLALDEPRPQIFVLGFGESAVDLRLSAWCSRANLVELKNGLQREIKEAFEEAGIEIPYPHRTVTFAPRPNASGEESSAGFEVPAPRPSRR